MKKVLLIAMMMLGILIPIHAQQTTPKVTPQDIVNIAKKVVDMGDTIRKVAEEINDIVAYSDTTSSLAESEEVEDEDTSDSPLSFNVDKDNDNASEESYDLNDPFGIKELNETWGVAIPILLVLFGIFVILIPILILILICVLLRNAIRRHNDRVDAATATGNATVGDTHAVMDSGNQAERLWNRALLNIALGAGLFVMFHFWDSRVLQGIGALVVCYGIGQLLIAWRGKKKMKSIDNTYKEEVEEKIINENNVDEPTE